MCWRRCEIRRISISRCTARRGSYHGFFWFYFINEHVLRFLNLRYPRDYNTVPRLLFWAVPPAVAVSVERVSSGGVASCDYRKTDRASRVRLLALCWAGFILVFFTFSTTQEYYSMPCYPALAMLLGCGDGERRRLAEVRDAGDGGGGYAGAVRRSRQFCGWCVACRRRAISRRR